MPILYVIIIVVMVSVASGFIGYRFGYSNGFWKAARIALDQGNVAIAKIAADYLKGRIDL